MAFQIDNVEHIAGIDDFATLLRLRLVKVMYKLPLPALPHLC